MDEKSIRIVELAPMRVAAALGFGSEPETIAIQTLFSWAEEKGLLTDARKNRYFGFNNPNPSAGSPNYGYEQWMTVPEGVEGSNEVTIKLFEGGLYAVGHCESLETIMQDWQQLAAWQEKSEYLVGKHQWLEEMCSVEALLAGLKGDFHPDAYSFDLYLPIMR
ncbi:effector binding domain-containing protein [Ornatilinea apprima]|uniref:effector binding domain-containing protein n=1 Tax=Ornatilinea apprima TaxID=1134406 RepID=UPI0009463577|nr:effector binding domain-containing protein [Ornatilinea apprima]